MKLLIDRKEHILLGGMTQIWPDMANSSLYEIINLFAGAALSMLPILIAISAAKKFGGNQFLAAVIGFIMVHPSPSFLK